MLKVHAEPLDFRNMSEQQWHDLLAVRTEFFLEVNPDGVAPSDQEQRERLSRIPESRDQVIFWLLYDHEAQAVGFCTLAHPKPESPDYETNKDRIYVEPVVIARHRRKGVFTQLLPQIVQYAQSVGATWLEGDTKFESGFRFCEKIGATEAGRQRTNRLIVDQVDWEMMQGWVAEGRSKNPGVELIRVANLPEPELIEPLCDLITDINQLQPRDAVEGINFTLTPAELENEASQLRKQKTTRVFLLAREPDGTLSGMTDLFHHETMPAYAHCGLTGVRPEFQNRGQAKWLKAAMLLDLRERHPEVRFVDTNNFNSNRPILSINDRMGFKLYEQYVFYKIRVADLATKYGGEFSSP